MALARANFDGLPLSRPERHLRLVPPRAVTVHEGDTLFSIASRAVPGASPYAVMAAIRQLNHMSDTDVFVGEQLLLPPS